MAAVHPSMNRVSYNSNPLAPAPTAPNPQAPHPPQSTSSTYRPPNAASTSGPLYSSYPSTSTAIPLPTTLDRPLPLQPRLQRPDVSLSAFSWLFSELIQYSQQRADSVDDIEKRLSDLGYTVGSRYLDLSLLRAAPTLQPATLARPRTLLSLLQHIHGSLWKQLFSHPADGLEKSNDSDDEYYIYDNSPITNRYLSVPKGLGTLNCAAFIAGIIGGVCDAAGFTCEVSAHVNAGAASKERTVYIVKFDAAVMKREAQLQG